MWKALIDNSSEDWDLGSRSVCSKRALPGPFIPQELPPALSVPTNASSLSTELRARVSVASGSHLPSSSGLNSAPGSVLFAF